MLPDALYILLICIITRRAGIASVFCGRGKGRGKEKLRHPLDTGVLGGRGWITRAALLKTAQWAVFTLSSATAPQLFESTLASPFPRLIKQKLQYPVRILEFLVGAGGFEPPKLKAADLQSVPIGHSGTRPYSFVVHPCAGRLVYFSMRKRFCQLPFSLFSALFSAYFLPPSAALYLVELRPVLC